MRKILDYKKIVNRFLVIILLLSRNYSILASNLELSGKVCKQR